MSQNSDDEPVINAAQVMAELINPALDQLTQAIGQLIEHQQAANNLLQTMAEQQAVKESDDKKEDTEVEHGTHKEEHISPQEERVPVSIPSSDERIPNKPLSCGPNYAPPTLGGAGLCSGCGQNPCPTPVSDRELTDALKAVKLLKAPEGGPFKGVADNRTGISFEREMKKCCGRMSTVVLYHYLLRHTTQSAQDSLEIGEQWPTNCHRDYDVTVGKVCTKLLTVFSSQASSEGVLQTWNGLQQQQNESVENFISKVLTMTTELRLAGLERPEREIETCRASFSSIPA
ncbi:hypothetical protein Pmar_PMAR003224 [Perkinsus marinus ATCC 50983]|uniref:Uncharacterized protein n=1 Tax=Perkinsus marinus (strain ATCC 50983 / TXsc) TaxID=423536 RepID=C5LKI4_PERM5|nr:hypothetical protein Pmar_PMAR003224 [Perkinsus marinus ATCC 50983]EER02751.1 hypothetical protein Pmar_PMAR003224 [Perkinsus marinus ATCC 50983]|eukprot:XP_002770935.1 hypothetical protein Pmar_PMAR003224 [Perkinsus marinus ATCC 50983]